jgi:hypothetical protein
VLFPEDSRCQVVGLRELSGYVGVSILWRREVNECLYKCFQLNVFQYHLYLNVE